MTGMNAYNQIKTMIYRGRLQPGCRLVERDLAQQLGVSRIPIREGLVRLESEGLVRSVPHSGTYVQTLDPIDILEIYSMRLWLEPQATRLATGHVTPALIARLNELAEQVDGHIRDNNLREASQADYDFHLTIIQGSKHKRLIRAYESSHIQITGRSDIPENGRPASDHFETAAVQHARIIDCMRRGRAQVAERVAYDHVLQVMERAESALGLTLEHD